MEQRYQLRKAAGCYWLLDMWQTGKTNTKPVILNENGAIIWQRLREGENQEAIAKEFHQNYGISEQEALQDIGAFLKQLEKQGVQVTRTCEV